MAMLVVAAAGSAIGSAAITGTVMGMTGAQIGWMAGSMLGSMLFKPPPQEGPRVADKKVTSTIYGETIPFVWGTDRCRAQVLWASDLIEAAEEVGGKGFGGPDGVVYTYSVNILLAVCKSPFGKPRYPLRLWGNGRLIGTFNGRGWDVDKALIQRGNIREYIGEENQDPDPVYEAAVGSANAPAYIGQLTIMLEGLQLADFGNRPPNFEVEVTSEIEIEDCVNDPFIFTAPAKGSIYTSGGSQKRFSAAYDPETKKYFVLTQNAGDPASKQIEIYNIRPARAAALERTLTLPFISPAANFGGTVIDPENRVLWVVFGTANTGAARGTPIALRMDLDTYSVQTSGATFSSYIGESGGQCWVGDDLVSCSPEIRTWGEFGYPAPNGGDGSNGGTGALYGAMFRLHPNSGSPSGEISWGTSGSAIVNHRRPRLRNGSPTGIFVAPCPACFTYADLGPGVGWHSTEAAGASNWLADVLYVPRPTSGGDWTGGINYQIRWGSTSAMLLVDEDSASAITYAPEEFGSGASTVFSRSRAKAFVINGRDVGAIELGDDGDPTTFTQPTFTTLESIPYEFQRAAWSEEVDGLVLVRFNNSALEIRVVDPETDEIIAGPCFYPEWKNSLDGQWGAINEVGNGWFVAVSYDGAVAPQRVVMFKIPGSQALGGGIRLWKIVSEVWEMAGGDLSEIDVTELQDIVPGYTLARQAAGRGVIQPLMGAWFFDCVESGTVVRWPKMGKAHVAVIDAGDLGAHVGPADGNTTPPYEVDHIDEHEAPRELTLKYIDALANYDPGTQRAARQAAGSLSPGTLDLPIVLDADHAATVVWTHLMRAHAAKNPVRFALSHQYEALEPGDAVALPMADGQYQRVVVQQRTSARPLIEYEGVLEDSAVWDRAFPGVDRGQLPRQEDVAELPDTLLEIMDLPPLRQTDDRLVAYMSMSRVLGDAWPGGAAYRSGDGGASYSALYNTSAEATMGYLVSELPAWTRGNIWDRENTVRVYLRRGTLSSATELAVLNGANAAVIGNEIIQFANATLVGDGIWELDALLRHRLGTEWAALTDHAMNTRFVLLTTASIRAVEYPLADMNVARSYKAVTAGQALADGTVTAFTAIGNSVKPLAPVKVEGARDLSGDLTVTWIRRARLNADWQDGFDVPLDEPSEQYRVYVFASSARTTVKRYEDVTSPTWTYSAADQTTDFGLPQDEVHLSIYQITPTYNVLGHAAEATV